MKKITGSFPGAAGLCDIRFYAYSPEKPKAAVMLSHGMCEYVEMYEEFAQFLCENDIALCGNDHIGHGGSVIGEAMLGYFGYDKGYIHMVRDLHRMKMICARLFPDIPHFLFAHSMGSFLGRIYLAKYPDEWRGAIFAGTAGGVLGQVPLRSTVDGLVKKYGGHYRHRNVTKTALGVFNLRYKNHRTRYDWLSRDEAAVDRFNTDPRCNFIFTLAGYRDMLNALMCANSESVFAATPTNVPILLLGGGMDPVGEYGHGPRAACIDYLKHGCDASVRIYPAARHMLLAELNKQEVMEDILEFLIKRI